MQFTFHAAEILDVPGTWAMEEMMFTEATQYLLSEVLNHFTLQKRETATGKANYSPGIYHAARQSNIVGCFHNFCLCMW